MDKGALDDIVALAEAASNKVSDSALRDETYKIVLTELLRIRTSNGGGAMSTGSAVTGPVQTGQEPSATSRADGPAAKLAAWLSVDENILSEIFEFEEGNLTVHLAHSVLPKKGSDAQRLLAYIKLAAEKIAYNTDEVPAKDLIAIVDNHGCKDANLAKNLKSSEYIIPKGGRGTMKTYRLRYTGMAVAQSDIKRALGVSE